MDKLIALNNQINALEVGQRLQLSNISEELYHSVEGYGSTVMKAATKTMAEFKHKFDKTWIPTYAQKSAFIIGRATHCLVLEPQHYDDRFVEMLANIKRKQGPAWETFKLENANKGILSHTEQAEVCEMSNAVLDQVGEIFTGGEAEVSYWYRHPCGLLLKSRIDYLKDGEIWDLKTNKADNPMQFARAIKYDYDIQDALYTLVTGIEVFKFLGVSKKAPYAIFQCKQGESVRSLARKKLDTAFNDLAFAIEFNDYPGYSLEMIETQLTPNEMSQLS